MEFDVVVAFAGLFVGFVVGLTGMGGGALMTPVLILLFNVQPLAAVSAPADTIIVHEVRNYNRVAQQKPYMIVEGSKRLATGITHPYYDVLHYGGASFVFCDGHVKWQRKDQTRVAQFGIPPELNPGKPTHLALDDATATAMFAEKWVPGF